MQKYTVVSDWDVPQTLIEKDLGLPADHIVAGTVIELPDADAADLVAAGTITLVQPLQEVGPFSVTVEWTPNAAQADMDAAAAFIAELTNEINGEASTIPSVIQSITIARI